MPHKHKRQGPGKAADFDLSPSVRAKSLNTGPSSSEKLLPKAGPKRADADAAKKKPRNKPTKDTSRQRRSQEDDDTPRAFARLMRFVQEGKRPPSGLDDGSAPKSSNKRKRGADAPNKASSLPSNGAAQSTSTPRAPPDSPETHTTSTSTLRTEMKIQPHERLSDFAARVDRSLPLITAPRKKDKNKGRPLTKHERRLRRLQTTWREEEERRRTKLEEEQEDLEDEREEDELLWGVQQTVTGKGKKRRKVEEDPWAEVARKRKAMGIMGQQRGLHDVVEAPPRLERPKAKFKAKDR